ncbi:serine hydrolase domain-containing protein [Liquorilactobacillus hordei]|uniref:Serine hydrolase n=1 Tax=Liquorilactobacillus hordei TaxID=468911 RepID=A0A3S6QLL1_9LACO|nr:serine hydrolase [Liquorilactobacillus hordei]AUJ28761.1 serine hydrolase [Liquorilactobacillus hordei]MBZ2406121.1 serine hydrolase [Liquorilactobacillus hordei]
MITKYEESITMCIKEAIKQQYIYGASYTITNETSNSQFYLGTQGTGKYDIAITSNMFYDLASLTKVVGTTTRVLQLIEEGKLSLNTEVGEILEGLKYPQLTIANLLLHNSGLPADIIGARSLTKEELVNKIKDTNLVSLPGEKVIYSDLGFILLGWIITQIDGNLSSSLNEHIFRPLKMQNTGYNLAKKSLINFVPTEDEPQRGGIIQGIVHDYKAYLMDGVSGHAGIFSTLEDLVNFTSMYINNGIFAEKRILSPQSYNLLEKYSGRGRTLGWQIWDGDPTKLWHTGFTGTSIALDLKNKRAFICLTNRIHPTRQKKEWIEIRKEVTKLFYNEY